MYVYINCTREAERASNRKGVIMQTRKTILVVDDTSNNLRLARNALVDIYNVITMPSAEKMYDFLAMHDPPPDLILLDVLMPGMD